MTTETEIWATEPLPPNVRLGADVRMERRLQTFQRFRTNHDPGLVLGDRVRVYTWTSFSVEDGVIEVGADSVLVGASFMCAERITVGRGVVISYNVTIADSDFHPTDPDLRRQDAIANAPEGDPSRRPRLESQPIEIHDDVRIGIGAIVLKGVTIGAGAEIGAGAVITRDVPAGARMDGNPARIADE